MASLNMSTGHEDIHIRVDLDEAPTIRILHVEDDQTIAANTKEMLEQQGWLVDSCSDADTGLARILSDARYHFLLVDYRLRGFNGLDLVRRARTVPHRAHTPIAVISATPVEAEAKDAGANVFWRKPQDIGLLVESINKLLGERHHDSLKTHFET